MKLIINSSLILLLGFLIFPFPSIQHFIWPLSWCLLADICNHTKVLVCGAENTTVRSFIDECDMFEYNCDYERDFEIVDYSNCLTTPCPVLTPCPKSDCLKNHRRDMMGDERRMAPEAHRLMIHTRRITRDVSLPMHMLKGIRRYTPETKVQRLRRINKMKEEKKTTKKSRFRRVIKYNYKTNKSTMRTVILRTEMVIKNGKKFKKMFKGLARQSGKPFKIVAESEDSDFLV